MENSKKIKRCLKIAEQKIRENKSISLETYAIQNKKEFLLKEWSNKNEFKPNQILYASNLKVFWECPFCNNSFYQTISLRTLQNCGCPNCNKLSTSFPEQSIYFYLNKEEKKYNS